MLGRSRNPSPGGDGSPHGLEVTSMDYEGGLGFLLVERRVTGGFVLAEIYVIV